MTADQLAFLAGAVLSLIFSYIPGLNVKFAGLASEYKRLIMLGLLALVAAAVFGISCTGFGDQLGILLACDKAGAMQLVQAFVIAAIANQTTYSLSPQTSRVTEARNAAREL